MSAFDKIIAVWQKAPLPVRRWFVYSSLAPTVRRLVNPIHGNEPGIFTLSGSLLGHRMRLHWQSHKAFVFGTYEQSVTEAVQQTVRNGWTVVDVGAHIGYYTLLMAKLVGPQGKVFSFEPMPSNFQALQENAALNGYKNVFPQNRAVMDRPSTVVMTRNDDDPLTSTAAASMDESQGDGVEAVSLDQFFGDSSERIAFVKMDVEGAEGAVLSGMERILKNDHPILLIEIHGFDLQGMKHPALEQLRKAGYSLKLVDSPAAQVHVLAEHRN